MESIMSMNFKAHKKNGWLAVKLVEKALFHDGKRCLQRALYYDRFYNKYFVILNHDAYEFFPYEKQNSEKYVVGRI